MKKFLLIFGVLLFVLILLFASGWGYLKYEQSLINSGEREKWESAKLQWDESLLTDYQMTVNYHFFLEDTCLRTIEVHANFDSAILIADSCDRTRTYPLTVIEMFDTIEFWLSKDRKCGGNGCRCDGPLILSGEYDPTFGFPTSLKVYSDQTQAWKFLEYWLEPWMAKISGELLICPVYGISYPNFEITSLHLKNP